MAGQVVFLRALIIFLIDNFYLSFKKSKNDRTGRSSGLRVTVLAGSRSKIRKGRIKYKLTYLRQYLPKIAVLNQILLMKKYQKRTRNDILTSFRK